MRRFTSLWPERLHVSLSIGSPRATCSWCRPRRLHYLTLSIGPPPYHRPPLTPPVHRPYAARRPHHTQYLSKRADVHREAVPRRQQARLRPAGKGKGPHARGQRMGLAGVRMQSADAAHARSSRPQLTHAAHARSSPHAAHHAQCVELRAKRAAERAPYPPFSAPRSRLGSHWSTHIPPTRSASSCRSSGRVRSMPYSLATVPPPRTML